MAIRQWCYKCSQDTTPSTLSWHTSSKPSAWQGLTYKTQQQHKQRHSCTWHGNTKAATHSLRGRPKSRRLGWQILKDGHLAAQNNITLDLQGVSYQRIKRLAMEAWMADHLQRLTNRPQLWNLQPTCRASHRQMIEKFNAREQMLLARQLAQCDQVETQKETWAADADGKCPSCHNPDSHRHRLLECPTILAFHTRHPEAIEALTERDEAFLAYPLPAWDTDANLHQAQLLSAQRWSARRHKLRQAETTKRSKPQPKDLRRRELLPPSEPTGTILRVGDNL